MTARFACRVCGHAEARADYLHLHHGRSHADDMIEGERDAFARAVAAEEAWLKAAVRHAKAGLAVLPIAVFYFFTVLAIIAAQANIALALLGLPGIVAFAGFVYFLVYTRDSMPAIPGRAPPLDQKDEP